MVHDSLKAFFEGVHKVRPPAETCEAVLARLAAHSPRLLRRAQQIVHATGVPHYRMHATNAYRVLVGTTRASGKGHSDEQALASGLMELVERYSCFTHLLEAPDAVYAAQDDLSAPAYGFEDVFSTLLVSPDRVIPPLDELMASPVTWFRGGRLDGRELLVPSRVISYAAEGTNGMASGNSFEEALLHAVLEVIERHCQTLIRLRALPTPSVRLETVDSAIGRDMIAKFAAAGEPVLVRDFSLGLGVPVIAVSRRLDDRRVQVTVGSATTREEALLRALSENVQTEGLMNCYPLEASTHYLAADGDEVSFEQIADVDDVNIRVELETVEGLLASSGMHTAYVDCTHPELGIPSVIAYVHGAKFQAEDFAQRSLLAGLVYDATRAGRGDEVRRLATQGLERDPANTALWLLSLAYVRVGEGDLGAALDLLARASADLAGLALPGLERRNLTIAIGTAQAHVAGALGRDDEAVAALARVLAADASVNAEYVRATAPRGVDPGDAEATAERHRTLHQLWHLTPAPSEESITAALTTFDRVRPDLERHLEEGERLLKEGAASDALREAKLALDLDEAGAELLLARWLTGRCLAKLRRHAEAVAELERLGDLTVGEPKVALLLDSCRRLAG